MRMTDMDGWVAFVGAGPGDDGLLTMRAARLLGMAGLVVAEPDVMEQIQRLLAADAVVAEPSDVPGTVKTLVAAAKAGQFAVRLYRGDPLFSGAAAEVQACAKAKVRFEIVPGVPGRVRPRHACGPRGGDRPR
jgi:uroporphyrinogen III methyltransferase/synthase